MQKSRISQLTEQIWTKAQIHGQASNIGKPLDADQIQVCTCCDQIIQKQPIPLGQHIKQFQKYGFGYALWFSFLKYCILLLLVLIASKTSTQMYMATKQNYDFCYNENEYLLKAWQQQNPAIINQQKVSNSPTHITSLIPDQINILPIKHQPQFHRLLVMSESQIKCTSFMIYLSIFKGQAMYQNMYLRFIQFFIQLIALIGVRNMILKEEQYYDQRTTLISKYSILLSGLPEVSGIKEKVRNMFEEEFSMRFGYDQGAQCQELICIFKNQKINQIHQSIQLLQNQLLQAQKNHQQQKYNKIHKQIHKIYDSLNEQTQKIRQDIDKDKIRCEKMIIIMKSQGDKAKVLYQFKQAINNSKDFQEYFDEAMTKNKTQIKLLMKEAPQPNQIIWQNIDLTDSQRKALIFQGWIYTILFLAVVTVIFYFLLLAKTNLFLKSIDATHKNPLDKNAKRWHLFAIIIVFAAILGVVLFNKFIMSIIINLIVKKERHAFNDKQNHAFSLKYALGMFFTTAIMTLAVQAFTFNNFYSHEFGVIQQQTIMFFVTSFLVPLIWLIHPLSLMRKLKKSKLFNKLVSQKQANQICQKYPYDLGKRYAEVLEIMWFTFLYCQLIPLGSFLSFIGLIIYYWVDKYNFLRRSSIKGRVSGKMAILGLKSLDLTLFLVPFGQFVFRFLIKHQIDYISVICMSIATLYMFSPISTIIWAVNGQNFFIEQKTYDEVKHTFKQTYYNLHPIYKLTHKIQIDKHKKYFREYLQQDIKKVKHYGSGRGTYKRNTSSERQDKTERSQQPSTQRVLD